MSNSGTVQRRCGFGTIYKRAEETLRWEVIYGFIGTIDIYRIKRRGYSGLREQTNIRVIEEDVWKRGISWKYKRELRMSGRERAVERRVCIYIVPESVRHK